MLAKKKKKINIQIIILVQIFKGDTIYKGDYLPCFLYQHLMMGWQLLSTLVEHSNLSTEGLGLILRCFQYHLEEGTLCIKNQTLFSKFAFHNNRLETEKRHGNQKKLLDKVLLTLTKLT